MKDNLNNFKNKWTLVLLCIFSSIGVHAQWGEQWQNFEDMVFAEGTGNSYWVFDDNGNAYAANNSSQEFQYTVFTSNGDVLDYTFIDPEEISPFLSGLNEEQFDDFFSHSDIVLNEVTIKAGSTFNDQQFVNDVLDVYLEALDKYGLTHQAFYGSSGIYGWNDGSAELFWSEYMPITSSFSKFYNGLVSGSKSEMSLGAGLLLLDIISLGESSLITDTTATLLKPLMLGSTGRTVAYNLIEQMTMKQAIMHPELGMRIMENMGDPRWAGWTKMQLITQTQNGINVVVHYVAKWENGILVAIDDFKFVN